MSDVSLHRMARALRESRPGRHPDPESSRAAIVRTVAVKQRRRRLGVVWLVPLAAVLVFSTALASVGSARRRLWRAYFEQIVRSERASPAAATRPAPPVEPTPQTIAAGPSPEAPVAPAETIPAAPAPPARRLAKSEPRVDRVMPDVRESPAPAVAASASTSAAASPVVPEGDDFDLYARAHEAHFVRHDPVAALAAWEAYLAAQPDGPFVLEARYNRALCLVRLGRVDEAKAALAPFRDGRFGSYRQVEATRLVDVLGRR
jgi:hypothetical protein